LVNEIVDLHLKFTSEAELRDWIGDNIELFGFSEIVEDRRAGSGSPDLDVKKDDEIIGVELETYSSHFLNHGHQHDPCDLLICLVEDKEVPVKTVEIESFEPIVAEKVIKVPPELKEKLDDLKRMDREPYYSVIDRLIESFEGEK